MEFVVCAEPGCGATAEIVDRWVLESTEGPIEHVRTRCLGGHVLTCLTERMTGLPVAGKAARTTVIGRRNRGRSGAPDESPESGPG